MIGVNTSIFKSAGRKLVNLLGALKDRATYYENGTDSVAEKNRIDDLGVLDKATILLTPTATSDARVHSVKTYTGDELVTDGSFENGLSDWDSASNVAIVNGAARFNNIGLSGANAYLIENSILEAGKTYKFECDVISTNGKDLVLERANPSNTSIGATTTGHKIIYFTQDTQPHLTIKRLTSETDVTIDNISVTEADADFDFDRASSATRINSDGLVQDMQSITDPELVLNGDFEELGSELVTSWTNKDFTFFSSSGSNITQMVSSGNGNNCYSSTTITNGKTYKLEFTCSQNILAQIRLSNNTNLTSAQTALSNPTLGLNTVYFTASSDYNYIGFYAASSFTDTQISSFTLKQVNVDSEGNDIWTLGTGWSIEDGKLVGTSVATQFAQQSFTFINGNTYKITFDITGADTLNDDTSFRLPYDGTGGNISYLEKDSPDGTYSHTFVAGTSSILYLGYIDNGTYTGTIDNISVKDITFSTDVDLARINYDSNGDNGHILLEPTSTNFVTYSEDFSQWTKSSGGTGSAPVITLNNSISPDGTQNADKIVFDKGTGTSVSDYSVLTTSFTSQSNTASIYIKADSPQRIVIRNSSTWEGYDIGTDWTRIEKTDTGGSIQIGLRDGYGVANVPNTATVYLWGAQVEALSYATSYIPNHGTAVGVTRATETLTGSGNSTLINSTEGVLYAEIAALADDVDGFRVLGISDGGASNRVFIGYNDSNQIYANIGTSTLVGTQYTPTNASNFHKVALKYENNNCKFFVDGTQIGTTLTSITIPSGMNSLQFNSGAGGSVFYGDCKALAVFNEALSDDELELLTGVTNYGSFGELASANGYTII